jgi:uncharacterized surface protein with fasciclin (FAS1) repeats
MRKALTLRALSATLSIALAAPGAVMAQDQAPREMPTTAPGEADPAPPPGDKKRPDSVRTVDPAPSAAPGEATRNAPTASILAIATANAPLSTLVTAVEAADLSATLSGPGPFTVFAPTNEAFAKLPPGTLDTLVKPENKAKLAGLLTYHVVAGTVSAADLARQIQAGGGTATLTTVAGGALTATLDGEGVVLTDAKGGKARVVAQDARASNGIIHAIDTVVMP